VAVASSGYDSSTTAKSVPTIRAWAKWQNAQGGIQGHPIQLFVEDTAGTPSTAQNAISTLLSDGVVSIFFLDGSTEAVVAPQLEAANMAVTVGSSFGPTVGFLPNFFSQAISAGQGQVPAVVVAKQVGAKSLSSVYCAEVAACALTNKFLMVSSATEGITYEGGLPISASAPNYTAQCLSLKQKNTQSLGISVAPSVAIQLIKDCVQQGFSPTYIVDGGVADLSLFQSPKGINYAGQLAGFPWWVNAAPVNTFRAVMKKYAPSTPLDSPDVEQAWESMQFFKAAVTPVAKSGLTKSSVLAAYYNVKNQTVGGLSPEPITYTAGQPQAIVTCFWLFKYKSGAANPTLLTAGKSGNGQTGGLQSTCLSPALVADGGKP
jgi:branched-chain amino acid transport system substrate-binding protein